MDGNRIVKNKDATLKRTVMSIYESSGRLLSGASIIGLQYGKAISARMCPGLTKPWLIIDDFLKSPSAALRFTLVVAAYQQVRLTPQVLRALHMELFTLPSQF